MLLGFVLGIAALVTWIAVRGPIKVLGRFTASPQMLLAAAIVMAVGALIWFLVILRSYAVMKRGQRFSGLQRALGGVLVASLIVIVGIPLGVGSAYALVTRSALVKVFGTSGGGTVQDAEDLWKDKGRINIFLLGLDSSDTREGVRPDSMLIASIDTSTGNTTLFSVPRNLNRPIFPKGSKLAEEYPNGFNGGDGEEDSLLNAVWDTVTNNNIDVGDTHGVSKGQWATMQAIEASMNLPISYWASVNMKGYEDVVNAMGGVKLDVERPIPIGGGNRLGTGGAVVGKYPVRGWINPGDQTLTGGNALWYVRSRDGSDNYDRMCRQQRMLKATLTQLNPQELALAYPKLAASATQNIKTDIPQNQLQAFIELANKMKGGKIRSAQINNTVIKTYNPDYDKLHAWVKEQIDVKSSSPKEKATGTSDSSSTASAAATTSAAASTPSAAATASDSTSSSETTGAPAPGIETADGKCYPSGYTPGSGWPGWPGNSSNSSTSN